MRAASGLRLRRRSFFRERETQVALTESQKKLAAEVAEGAPSTDAARKNLDIDPPMEEPNNIDGAPVYPEPKQKTPEEMATNPKDFLDRLDQATRPVVPA